MKDKAKELQKLRGVGEVMASRFIEAGIDSFKKVASAGEEKLKSIKGLNPRAIPSIIAQAAELAESTGNRAKKIEEHRKSVAGIKETVQGLALSIRDRFAEELVGKGALKVEKELGKIIGALEKVEAKLGKKVKKAGKSIVKAEERLVGLAEMGLKEVGDGLKKARKSLKRIYT